MEEREERYVTEIPCDFHVQKEEDARHQSVRADTVLRAVQKSQWKNIRWREGPNRITNYESRITNVLSVPTPMPKVIVETDKKNLGMNS